MPPSRRVGGKQAPPAIKKDAMIPINQIICGRNEQVLASFPDDCIDLSVTSPPYDSLRAYKGYAWEFEQTAQQLYRVTKPGGVLVWVVGDETKDFCESLTSFKQVIYFVEMCGFNLLDTMFYHKKNYAPAYPGLQRYAGVIEYMFVLSKGRPRTFNAQPEQRSEATKQRQKIGSAVFKFIRPDGTHDIKTIEDNGKETKDRTNVWSYGSGAPQSEHPAIFPEKLAEDHILSWSNAGDLILDPFVGSGTVPKMAIKHHRRFIGIDISEEYCALARRRIGAVQPVMFDVGAF